jgi:hypothetical protein
MKNQIAQQQMVAQQGDIGTLPLKITENGELLNTTKGILVILQQMQMEMEQLA